MALQSFDSAGTCEARQFLLDNRCGRKHPKRHRTMKRAKAVSAKKKFAVKAAVAERESRAYKYKAKVRAYWAGQGDYP